MNAAVYLNEATKTYGGPDLPGWTLKPPHSSRALFSSTPALDRVSFRVDPVEIFGIVGPSGAGKTTLIRVLAAQLHLDSGEGRVFGLDLTRQRVEVARLTNRVSVEASFFKSLSALDNLVQSAQAYVPGAGSLRLEISALLARLGLEARRQQKPMEALERNEQQLVAIARAVLSRARLLLLDEPFAGLDVFTRYRVSQTLRDLREAAGVTIVFAARSLADVEMLADRWAVLTAGRLTTETTGVNTPLWSSRAEPCVVDA